MPKHCEAMTAFDVIVKVKFWLELANSCRLTSSNVLNILKHYGKWPYLKNKLQANTYNCYRPEAISWNMGILHAALYLTMIKSTAVWSKHCKIIWFEFRFRISFSWLRGACQQSFHTSIYVSQKNHQVLIRDQLLSMFSVWRWWRCFINLSGRSWRLSSDLSTI